MLYNPIGCGLMEAESKRHNRSWHPSIAHAIVSPAQRALLLTALITTLSACAIFHEVVNNQIAVEGSPERRTAVNCVAACWQAAQSYNSREVCNSTSDHYDGLTMHFSCVTKAGVVLDAACEVKGDAFRARFQAMGQDGRSVSAVEVGGGLREAITDIYGRCSKSLHPVHGRMLLEDVDGK